MLFNDRLKELRVDKCLKQAEVAEKLGISVLCYAGYEQGYREPHLKTLIALCKFFGVSSDYLFGLED